jgi:undecaprenyl diphosphate synthase
MDGNGRWAQARGLPRSAGHKAGYEHIPKVLEMCQELGVRVVSGYAWSTENWGRPKPEVQYIMKALEKNLPRFIQELHERGVRFRHCGISEKLSPEALRVFKEGEALTRENEQGVFNLVFNYGGRAEIVEAARRIVQDAVPPVELSEQALDNYMLTAGLPDVDLVFRTGGEYRLSNFLLWQSAHACIYVSESYWPALSKEDLEEGIRCYCRAREGDETELG